MTNLERWKINDASSIIWNVVDDKRLPHSDHVEMSGTEVSLIVHYTVTAERQLELSREIIWPALRTEPNDVRGYLRRDIIANPIIRVNGKLYVPGIVVNGFFTGCISFHHARTEGINLSRYLSVSPDFPRVIEIWILKNNTDAPINVEIERPDFQDAVQGVYGEYALETAGESPFKTIVEPGRGFRYIFAFQARIALTQSPPDDLAGDAKEQTKISCSYFNMLQLETPDEAINCEFNFAKLRAAESIFVSKMGLVHSPGGGRYYGGVWANDQVEYSGPFFPFLGDETANEAALNAYRIFAKDMGPDYAPIWSSHEVEGDVPCCGKDRGDAAMYAYGASRFALARGDREIAEELWPAIEWSLEYCRRKMNGAGVIESQTDELEGRFPTGDANLSTSCLTYGGLRSAADLALALDKPDEAAEYARRADALEAAIEDYFGGEVEGYPTYRYYDGNTTLRAWICLPLAMGILTRKAGTIAALFSPQLWMPDGLATESGDKVFWDRATLYALRGVFAAGETEEALEYLTAYTRRRLLGDHVPYPVEAYPEGDGAHLSAESALYCRIITEGLFGITPTGLNTFRCVPRLPASWPEMRLTNIRAFGSSFDLHVQRENGAIRLTVSANGETILDALEPKGGVFVVKSGK